MRKKMSKGKDKRVFKQTANKSKLLNVCHYQFRGGIRL